MPNLREIVQQRAKVPAKIHSLEAAGVALRPTPATPAGGGGPVIVEYAAGQAAAADPSGGACNAAPRPPRAPGASTPGGSSAGNPPLRKASEARKPRASSAAPAPGRRSPSEPPLRNNVQDNASNAGGRAPAPQAKARASSLNRAKIGDAAPPLDRKDVGKVPVYLKRRQEEAAEDRRRAARPPSPQAPPGYRKVADGEKQATLDVLKRRKQEVEVAERNLPFKIETPGQKKREKDLSDRKDHLDKLLGMFSKPVVFIPADAEPIAASVPPLPQDLAGRPTRDRDSNTIGEDGAPPAIPQQARPGPDPEASPPAGVRQNSREGRARAMADRRAQACDPAPWDKGAIGQSPSSRNNIHTGVQVSAPPGGRSSLNLGWD